jgi:hypothetical protein
MAARRSPLLLGRAGERGALDRPLENVWGGQSAVLVIRGDSLPRRSAELTVQEDQIARLARMGPHDALPSVDPEATPA